MAFPPGTGGSWFQGTARGLTIGRPQTLEEAATVPPCASVSVCLGNSPVTELAFSESPSSTVGGVETRHKTQLMRWGATGSGQDRGCT